MILSIIVPVYNTEKYLPKCLDSILNQTMTDFELILVDDGSIDASGKICDEYAIKDDRIRVFHKKNEGACMARKAGVEASGGEFVAFVDSDDWIHPQMYDFLLQQTIKNDAEIITSGLEYEGEDLRTVDRLPEGVYTGENLRELHGRMIYDPRLLQNGVLCSVCTKIYRRELMTEALRAVTIPIKAWEDLAYVYLPFLKAEKVQITHSVFYCYRNNETSTTHKKDPNLFGEMEKSYRVVCEIYRNAGEQFVRQVTQLFIAQILFLIGREYEEIEQNKEYASECIPQIAGSIFLRELVSSEAYGELKLSPADRAVLSRMCEGRQDSAFRAYRLSGRLEKGKNGLKSVLKKILGRQTVAKIKNSIAK